MSRPHAGLRSYRPGEWYAVLGPAVSLVLPPSERARAAALWEMVDDGAGLEEVLDALIADGLRSLSGFALLGATDDGVRVVLRGQARATVAAAGEAVTLAGTDSLSWVDRTFRDVTDVALDLGDDAGPDHLVESGLVRVSRVDQPPRTASAPPPVPPPVEPTPVEPAPADTGEPTIPTPVSSGPPTVAQTAHPEGPEAGPGWPPDGPERPSGSVATLHLSNGEVIEVDRVLLIGRAPESTRATGDEEPRLVTVPSPRQEISSTHLEIRPGTGADEGGAVAIDLGSTNGTVVVQPGLPPEALTPGVPVPLVPGTLLDLGDGMSIQVDIH